MLWGKSSMPLGFATFWAGLLFCWGSTRWDLSISNNCKSKRAFNLKRIVKEVTFLTLFSWGLPLALVGRLSSVLAIAASGGNGALQGGLLMLVYTLGLALPFLAMAMASGWVLQRFSKLKPHMGTLKKIGGALIILMGILLMLGNLNALASLFG